LKKAWRGPGVADEEYRILVQCAKVCLGLVSKQNRDLHTTRSLEIPSIGSVLCAERTAEHSLMYEEGVEAEYWSSAQECAEKCWKLLFDDGARKVMAERGRRKFLASGNTSEGLLTRIFQVASK